MSEQKNIVQGNISNVGGDVRIGDDIHNHHHYNTVKLSKELTLHIPKIHPDDIIGREQDLKQLHILLNAQKRVVVVNGMGGIGKTTLVQAYIHQYYQQYQHIVWITQTSDNILNDVVNTAGLIQTLGVDTTDAKQEELFNQIILKLKNIPEQPNLFIIDNGEQSLHKYRDLLPGQPNWHLLVTSRETIEGFYQQDLGFLSEAESIALFRKHYHLNYLSEEEIKDLVVLVDYHTLTIEILAKMAVVQRYDAQKLKKAIQDDLRANIQVAHNRELSKIERVTSYLKTVFTFTRVTENERWLLKQLAALPTEFHTYELLRDLLIDEKGGSAVFFSETLQDLVQKGWILQNKATDNFKMHRIIAEVVKLQLAPHSTEMPFLLHAITDRLDFAPTDNPVDSFRWISFGYALLDCLANDNSKTIAVLQNNLALTLKNQGNYFAAKELLIKALEADEMAYGPYHPTTAIRNSNLATVLLDLGDYEHAKSYMEKAVLSDEKNFGPEHPTTARRYSNLAMILQNLKDYAGAKSYMEKAILADEKTFGPDHPTTARRYSNFGLVLKDLGEPELARTYMKKALQSDIKNLGLNHPTIAKRYTNLGVILQDLGDYEGAESLMNKALELEESIYGTQHPVIAATCVNLSSLFGLLNKHQEALKLLERALTILRKTLPEDHPNLKGVNKQYLSFINLLENKQRRK
jgi:tetratricopeptide (TPR) repeat protein